MNHNDATAKGYAAFNQGNHVCIDVPDGQTTYSFRTSDGRRLTVCFLLARDGNPPEICDIAYHGKEGDTANRDNRNHQAFETITFGERPHSPGIQFDTRTQSHPASIVCVLMEPVKAR